MVDQKEIMKRIRDIREDADIKQILLAEWADMDNAKLCKLEKGDQEITLNDFIAICKALEVPPADLLEEDFTVGCEAHIAHRTEKDFEIRLTSDINHLWNNGIYTQEDLAFAMTKDYIVLTIKDYLFAFMKELASANKMKKQMPEVYSDLVKKAFLKVRKQKREEQKKSKKSQKEYYILVSAEQLEENVKKVTEETRKKYLLANKKQLESIIREEVKLRIKTEFVLEELED